MRLRRAVGLGALCALLLCGARAAGPRVAALAEAAAALARELARAQGLVARIEGTLAEQRGLLAAADPADRPTVEAAIAKNEALLIEAKAHAADIERKLAAARAALKAAREAENAQPGGAGPAPGAGAALDAALGELPRPDGLTREEIEAALGVRWEETGLPLAAFMALGMALGAMGGFALAAGMLPAGIERQLGLRALKIRMGLGILLGGAVTAGGYAAVNGAGATVHAARVAGWVVRRQVNGVYWGWRFNQAGVGANGFRFAPRANHPELQRAVGYLFRPQDKFPGGTAGMLRMEKLGYVGSKTHATKAKEAIPWLKRLAREQPLGPEDQATVRRLIQDLIDALAGR